MKKLLVPLAVLAALGLIWQLRAIAITKADIASTIALLQQTKAHAQQLWRGQPAPDDLSGLSQPLPWPAQLQARVFARGTKDAEARTLQLLLPAVPPTLCTSLLQALNGKWLRLEANNAAIAAPLNLSMRRQICAAAPDIAVYFRF